MLICESDEWTPRPTTAAAMEFTSIEGGAYRWAAVKYH